MSQPAEMPSGDTRTGGPGRSPLVSAIAMPWSAANARDSESGAHSMTVLPLVIGTGSGVTGTGQAGSGPDRSTSTSSQVPTGGRMN